MSTKSRIDLFQLSTLPLGEPLRPRRRKRQRVFHRWEKEELNLILYLRLHRDWTWSQIQKTYFPSVSVAAVKKAYSRIPSEDRAHCASIVPLQVIDPRNTADISRSTHEISSTHSSSRRGPNQSTSLVPGPPRSGNNVVTVTLCTSNSEDGNGSIINDRNTARYNLRPNRLSNLGQSRSRFRIDRRRFPHFFRACKNHSKLRMISDRDYIPPSHSPTPDSSDRSPSVISSQLSDASSLELFGLEARPVSSSGRDSSVNPSSLSDELSSEFVSAEEHPTPP